MVLLHPIRDTRILVVKVHTAAPHPMPHLMLHLPQHKKMNHWFDDVELSSFVYTDKYYWQNTENLTFDSGIY